MRVFFLAFALALSPPSVAPAGAQTAPWQKVSQPPKAKTFVREAERNKVNENVLMLLGAQLGGPYIQLAQDIAVAVNDGDNLRVLPVASDGSVKNVRDVLLLRGADLGITTVQVLNDLKASGEYGPALERQVAYIAILAVDTFHVLARSGINSIQDLKGKKVSFNIKGSGTWRFGPQVFKKLGIDVTETNMAQGDAIEALRKGELDASVCSCPLPVPAFPSAKSEWGLKFLEVPYVPALEQDYVPASLTNANYPSLIAKDEKVQTIATSTILITFNWGPGTERYKKIEKFVDAFFSNFDKLRQPPRHPGWRDVNLSAKISGWQRFPAAKQWLDRQGAEAAARKTPPGIDLKQARTQAAKAAPHDAAEQERLFHEFLEWKRKQPNR
jgi:TRAP transporter TAXI family solute receptor